MGNPPVELVGDFDSAEARFLRTQFDDCRIELIARSLLDQRTALLRWQPAADVHPRAVETTSPRVTDRRRRPPIAWYVLEHEPDLRLAPITTSADLQDRYPRHFPTDIVPDQPARKGCLPFPGLFWPVLSALALGTSRGCGRDSLKHGVAGRQEKHADHADQYRDQQSQPNSHDAKSPGRRSAPGPS